MFRLRRVLFVFLVIIVLVGLGGLGYGAITVRRIWPQIEGRAQVDGLQAEVTIIRDSWGVPHIYASNVQDLFLAQGYVHAQDRFWQIEFSRRAGSGRLSEILGEASLSSDRFIRTIGWHRTAVQEAEQLTGASLEALEAYAEGITRYIAGREDQLALEIAILGLVGTEVVLEPWTPVDSLAWGKVMAWDLGGNMSSELVRAQIAAQQGTPAIDELMPAYRSDHPVIVPYLPAGTTLEAVPDVAFNRYFGGAGTDVGSNGWVVSGNRTETGAPLLANDPHLGIQMPSIWYEIGLHCEPVGPDCPYDVTGASFPGVPGVIIGHNARIAWGVTNLGPDVQDLFIERVNPQNPDQYEFQGAWLDMEIIREEIAVAGREAPVIVEARATHHGPIVNDVVGGEEEEWSFGWQPLALSWTALEPGTIVEAILLLNQAGNWQEFREALSYWNVPSQNFVYADVDGSIGYQAPGQIPIRAKGNGSVPVPGWTGEYEWVGTIPFDELPRAFNPEEGYVVTANNAVVGPDYPYFISLDWAPGYRARRIQDLISADDVLSIQDLQSIQGDNRSTWTEDIMPYLSALSSDEPRLTQALEMMNAWDGHSERESGAAALFESFRIHLTTETFADELGEELLGKLRYSLLDTLMNILPEPDSRWFDDQTTSQVETRDEILLQALEAAVEELSERLGQDMTRWQWGDLHTATFENQSLGQSGIGLIEAIFNRGPVATDGAIATLNNTGHSMNRPYGVATVPSYRQIIDLGDLSRSLSIHTTGQSGHPFHPHYDDMIDPWRNIEYHPMLWRRQDVQADAEGVLILHP